MCDVSKMYNHGGKMKDVKQCWYYTVCYYQISLQVETKHRINHHQNGVFSSVKDSLVRLFYTQNDLRVIFRLCFSTSILRG